MSLTPEQIQEIAVRAAEEVAEQVAEKAAQKAAARVALSPGELDRMVVSAVRHTLIEVGVDISNPLAMQRDFQHLRRGRRAGEDVRHTALVAMATFVATVAASLIAYVHV